MQITEAKRIIGALASHSDPSQIMALATDLSCNQYHLRQALQIASKALEHAEKREHCSAALPVNAGKAWTPAEDQRLLAGFDRGLSVKELALDHQRTHGGITARLIRKGKMEPVETASPLPGMFTAASAKP